MVDLIFKRVAIELLEFQRNFDAIKTVSIVTFMKLQWKCQRKRISILSVVIKLR